MKKQKFTIGCNLEYHNKDSAFDGLKLNVNLDFSNEESDDYEDYRICDDSEDEKNLLEEN